jgi:hypothetical protein
MARKQFWVYFSICLFVVLSFGNLASASRVGKPDVSVQHAHHPHAPGHAHRPPGGRHKGVALAASGNSKNQFHHHVRGSDGHSKHAHQPEHRLQHSSIHHLRQHQENDEPGRHHANKDVISERHHVRGGLGSRVHHPDGEVDATNSEGGVHMMLPYPVEHHPTRQPTTCPPSEHPTEHPTEAPSERSTEPTESPTENPTENPTEGTTDSPTESPTENTESPTESPSESPTIVQRTRRPTEHPTTRRRSPSPTCTCERPHGHHQHSPTENPTEAPTEVHGPAPTCPTNDDVYDDVYDYDDWINSHGSHNDDRVLQGDDYGDDDDSSSSEDDVGSSIDDTQEDDENDSGDDDGDEDDSSNADDNKNSSDDDNSNSQDVDDSQDDLDNTYGNIDDDVQAGIDDMYTDDYAVDDPSIDDVSYGGDDPNQQNYYDDVAGDDVDDSVDDVADDYSYSGQYYNDDEGQQYYGYYRYYGYYGDDYTYSGPYYAYSADDQAYQYYSSSGDDYTYSGAYYDDNGRRVLSDIGTDSAQDLSTISGGNVIVNDGNTNILIASNTPEAIASALEYHGNLRGDNHYSDPAIKTKTASNDSPSVAVWTRQLTMFVYTLFHVDSDNHTTASLRVLTSSTVPGHGSNHSFVHTTKQNDSGRSPADAEMELGAVLDRDLDIHFFE